MKLIKKLFLALLILLFLNSCDFMHTSKWEDESIDHSNIIISDCGQSIVLSSPYLSEESEWFSCSDINGMNEVYLETGKTINSSPFSEIGIKYYKCKFNNESTVFAVGYTGLPTIYVTTSDGGKIDSRTYYKNACLTTVYKGEKSINNSPVEIKCRGNASFNSAIKKSYTFKFGEKTKVCGFNKSKKWALLGCQWDDTFLSVRYATYLSKEVFDKSGLWEPSSKSVNVVINGQYMGTYVLIEPIKVEKNRLNLQDNSTITNNSEDVNNDGKVDLYDGGFVCEITWIYDGIRINTLHGTPVCLADPDLEENESSYSRTEIVQHITGLLNRAEAAIYKENNLKLSDVIDVDSFVEWFLLNDFVANGESCFRNSCYLTYNPQEGKFFMGPDWDYDKAFQDVNSHYTGEERNVWFRMLLQDNEFKKAVKNRWQELRPEILSSVSWINPEFDKLSNAIEMDWNRWGFYHPEASRLPQWIETRLANMDSFIESL